METPAHLEGSLTALITPFADDGARVDYDAFAALVEWQLAEGTHGLVPCGTTGEASTLTMAEHIEVVRLCVETAAGRAPTLAGVGSNATREMVELVRAAEDAGARAALIVAPYYNRPSQEGIARHFMAAAEATDAIELYAYNIPSRSAVNIETATFARLRETCPRFVGVKDATADLARATAQRLACGEDFVQLSGEDGSALGFMAHGGRGCVSVSSNVAPGICARFQRACLDGAWGEALRLHDALAPLHAAMFAEPSPAPAKGLLAAMGRCAPTTRLPMTQATEACVKRAREALTRAEAA